MFVDDDTPGVLDDDDIRGVLLLEVTVIVDVVKLVQRMLLQW